MAEEENNKEGEEKEEESEEQSSDDSKAEDEKEEGNPIDEAKGILEGMVEQNKIFAKNIEEAKKAGADLMLSGRAPAGREKTQADKVEDSARTLVEGTGLERMAGFKLKK